MSALSENVLGRTPRPPAFGPNLALWIVLLAVVTLFSQTLASLAHLWIDTADYQHGFLIALISLGLIFRSRERIENADIGARPMMLLPLAATLLVWMVAYRANSEMLQQIVFPIVLLMCIFSAFGPAVARITLFPVCFLYFAIPIWDHLVPLLQAMSTAVSEHALGLLGVPTQVEGFNVTIPEGRFTIIEGCSGKRYLIIALTLAALVGVQQGVRRARMPLLIACAVVLALILNWLRIIIIIYAGHVSNMQHYLVAVEHFSLGYVLYIPLLVAIVMLARRLGGEVAHAPYATQSGVSSAGLTRGIAGPVGLLLLATIVLVGQGSEDRAQVTLSPLPLLTSTWQGPLPALADWTPAYAGASAEMRASYGHGGQRIEVYANAYGVQSRSTELIQVANTVTPPGAWTVIRPIDIAAPLDAHVAASHSSVRWVVAQVYSVGGRITGSAGEAQLRYGWSALWRPTPSGVLALAAACGEDCDSAAEALSAFWTENAASLAAMIPKKL
jgi:EpsI family protein